MPNAAGKLYICVDFDGVLHAYTTWKGLDVFDGVVEGAPEAMRHLHSLGHTLILHTTRAVTPALMSFLGTHGIPIDYYNENPEKTATGVLDPRKPLADIYIDDRAVTFKGNWSETVNEIAVFKQWCK